MKSLNIAIIGAGMGGLAAAAGLRKMGQQVTVYEQARQFSRLGAGIQIGCNAMHVLRGLGLEARLRADTFYPRSWNNRDWKTGEILFDMLFGQPAEDKYGAPYLLAHRGDLHAALASAVPDEIVRLNHRLTGIEQKADGAVRLIFDGGATIDADAVVAADGVNSVHWHDCAGGGQVVVVDGKVVAEMALPVCGLISDQPLEVVAGQVDKVVEAAHGIGITLDAPFMSLSFLGLSVIPDLRITDLGLIDVNKFAPIPVAV